MHKPIEYVNLTPKLVKYVDKRAGKLFDEQAERLGLHRPNGRYLKYLVLQFAASYPHEGQEAMLESVQGVLAADQRKVEVSKPKMLQGLDKVTKALFAGYSTFMDVEQAEFLKYLVLQHKIHEDAMNFDELKAIVYSYVE